MMTDWIPTQRLKTGSQQPDAASWMLARLPNRLSLLLFAIAASVCMTMSLVTAADVDSAAPGTTPVAAPETPTPAAQAMEANKQVIPKPSRSAADKEEDEDDPSSEDIPMEQPWDYCHIASKFGSLAIMSEPVPQG